MAACARSVLRVLGGVQRAGGPSVLSRRVLTRVPSRTFAAVKTARNFKGRKEEAEKKKEVVVKAEPVVHQVDKDRHKPYGKTAWFPVDDVYVRRYYPRDVYPVAVAVDLLHSFRALDFTPLDQVVLVDLRLDMKLQKKKKVDPFVSTVHLPHPIKKETNRVIVFTENPDQVKVALEGGASAVGGAELVQQILDDEISADFYVAVPEILPKLLPLKNKLRKRFPKAKRGSVGIDIPKMMAVFTSGHEYAVERDCYVVTQIGTMDMPKEKLLENLQAVVIDVCKHRPDTYGHFIERAIISSQTSEALWFKSEDILPPPPPENDS